MNDFGIVSQYPDSGAVIESGDDVFRTAGSKHGLRTDSGGRPGFQQLSPGGGAGRRRPDLFAGLLEGDRSPGLRITRDKLLGEEAQQRGLETLGRFAERLRGFAPETVRAVATNTLRVAKNAGQFIERAEAVLGFPIEVIGGREEAPPDLHRRRARHSAEPRQAPGGRHRRRLERIRHRQEDRAAAHGIAVHGLRQLHAALFPDGRIDKKRFAEAEIAAAREIEAIRHDYRTFGWNEAVASSGTAKAVADILEINGLNPDGITGISREGLDKLKAQLIRAGSAGAIKLERAAPRPRAGMFAGGVAILRRSSRCSTCRA